MVTPSIWLEPSSLYTTVLPLARRMAAIISTVEVFPLLPVTAMMQPGSFTRPSTSGQIFRAYWPGRLLPLPTSLPMKRRSLQTIIARIILIGATLPLFFVIILFLKRKRNQKRILETLAVQRFPRGRSPQPG